MNQEAKELKAFLDLIAKNPLDMATRLIFAEWLDEHDEPELAAEQRAFNAERHEAEKWLRQFCEENYADYDELVEAAVSGKNYCFGCDDGPYQARRDPEFWRCIEIVAGKELDESHRERASFSCAC